MKKVITVILLSLFLFGCGSVPPNETLTQSVVRIGGSKEAAVGCQAADVITTKLAISSGVGVEGNPLMKGLMSHGFGVFVAFKAAIAWALASDKVNDESRLIANAITCGAVANNAKILLK